MLEQIVLDYELRLTVKISLQLRDILEIGGIGSGHPIQETDNIRDCTFGLLLKYPIGSRVQAIEFRHWASE